MTEKGRNLLIGMMVLLALVILCAMIIIFHEIPTSIKPGYEIRFTSRDTGGVLEGADVLLNGIRIGRISKIYFTDGDPTKGVTLAATIEPGVKIPRNIVAHFYKRGLGGSTIIMLKTIEKPTPGKKTPATSSPWLPTDQPVTIPIDWPAGEGGLLPAGLVAEISDTLKSVKRMTETLTNLINPPESITGNTETNKAEVNLHNTLSRLDDALTAITTVLGDKENQENIKISLRNLKSATTKAVDALDSFKSTVEDARATLKDISGMTRSTASKINRLLSRLMVQADNLGQVLASLHHIITTIESGKGTLGQLVNNPNLYEGIVDAVDQLKITLEMLQKVLIKWKQEGIKIQLGK